MKEINNRRQERIENLEKVRGILKTEFIGLNGIIDELLCSISPWYITPEVIKRPTIISLWGMTGTGKTSVVRRLLKLLDLNKRSVYFDCGAEADSGNRNNDIVDNICRSLGSDPEDISASITDAGDMVVIFDEFQYARTLSEEGSELTKSNLRAIWKLLDDGVVDINDSADWDFQKFVDFVEDIEPFAKANPGMKVVAGELVEEGAVKKILDEIGFYLYPYRGNPTYEVEDEGQGYLRRSREDEESDKENPYRPLKLLDGQCIRAMVKKMARCGLNPAEKMVELMKIDNLFDYAAFLRDIVKLNRTRGRRTLSCSRSLIFIIGNLDEAFQESDEMSPDIDADIFRDITSRVTVSDIKEALLKRFRPEQVARIGNNLIKYPTLGKEDFKRIIEKEVLRILADFSENIKVTVRPEIYELLYQEGVYPTQGVRPIFTTIGTLLTPFLSKIVIDKVGEEVEIGLKDVEDCTIREFKIPKTTVTLKFGEEKITEYVVPLQLGALRNPENCKTRYGNAVHEAGHAVVFSYLTGEAPSNIVAVSADGGGFCSTYQADKEKEIKTRKDINDYVKISLAGYTAEELVFPDPEMRLMGSSCDIKEAWNMFAGCSLDSGYIDPFPYSSHHTQNTGDGWFSGFSSDRIEGVMHNKWISLREETAAIIKKELPLIKELAKWMGKYGSVKKEKYLEFVEKYGTKLSKEMMAKTKEENSPEYYLKKIERL